MESNMYLALCNNEYGEGEIRTHDTLAGITVFPPEADPPLAGKIVLLNKAVGVRFELTILFRV